MKRANHLGLVISLLALGVGAATPAKSAPITETINFEASNFAATGGFSETPPFASVSGSFTITFDPNLLVPVTNVPLVLNSIDIPVTGSAQYNYSPITHSLLVGMDGVGGLSTFTNDFIMQVDNFDTAPTFFSFAYTQDDNFRSFSSTTGSVSLVAVPGPLAGAGLPGLVAACAGLLAWWRRKRKDAAPVAA